MMASSSSYFQPLSEADEEEVGVNEADEEEAGVNEANEEEVGVKVAATFGNPRKRRSTIKRKPRKYLVPDSERHSLIVSKSHLRGTFKTDSDDIGVHMEIIVQLQKTILTFGNPVYPDPHVLNEDDYVKLHRKALKDSSILYDSLKERNKLSSRLTRHLPELKRLQTDYKGHQFYRDSHLTHVLLYYFHYATPRYIEEYHLDPYILLRLNRDKDGYVLFENMDDMTLEGLHGLCWSTKKSHQYTLLFDELRKIAYNEKWMQWEFISNKFNIAIDILVENKLNLLNAHDIHGRIWDVIQSRKNDQMMQQYDFCCFLIDNELQEICTDDEKMQEVKKKFPLLDDDYFYLKVNFVYPHGKKRASQDLLEEKLKIEQEHSCNIYAIKGLRLKAYYYKLKLEKAYELGIIKLEKQMFIDNPNVSEWKLL